MWDLFAFREQALPGCLQNANIAYMRIVWRSTPRKMLDRMQSAKAQDVVEAVERIARDPAAPNNNIRPLRGIRNGFRVRVGDWRVSYTLDRAAATLEVFEVAPRGGAYR